MASGGEDQLQFQRVHTAACLHAGTNHSTLAAIATHKISLFLDARYLEQNIFGPSRSNERGGARIVIKITRRSDPAHGHPHRCAAILLADLRGWRQAVWNMARSICMAPPAIVWRNPNAVHRRRLWNQARQNANRQVYIVVRSGFGNECEWEGLPNLEMIEGGAKGSGKRERELATGRPARSPF